MSQGLLTEQILKLLPLGPSTSRKNVAVRLKPKGEQAMRQGHPWIFEDSIERISHSGAPGDLAVVFDGKGSFMGAGLFDPGSLVRVKVLSRGRGTPVDGDFLKAKAAEAIAARAGRIPPETDAYRVANGDSDGFPGLVADLYADILVLKVYSPAWIPWLGLCAKAFAEGLPQARRLALRLSRELQRLLEAEGSALADGLVLPEGQDGLVTFRENGLLFEADAQRGQKTGFFLDQRDNRAEVGSLSSGRRALNLFSYSGGFSLYAARGGAKQVVSVDFSKPAIEAACRNFSLNMAIPSVAACRHEGVAGDAFEVLASLASEGRRFELVVVDPPSFAKSAAEVPGALRSYGRLCKSALRVLAPGGTLVFASCSSRVDADAFIGAVCAAASETGRPLREFKRTFHAPDHPARFKESSYLKCLYATA